MKEDLDQSGKVTEVFCYIYKASASQSINVPNTGTIIQKPLAVL